MNVTRKSLLVFLLLIGIAAKCGAATVDEVMLYNKPDRQKILLEGAKKEGKITWYTSLIVDQVVRPVKEAFEKKYPFIQIEPFRGNSERIVQKMFAEYQGKRYEVDIVDGIEFDEVLQLALAESAAAAAGGGPSPDLKGRLMQRVREATEPSGFSFAWRTDDNWIPHVVPGIRMKVLALNRRRGYATLLLDVQPGTRFPAHHHGGAEECYVISGSLITCGRRLGPAAAGDRPAALVSPRS